MRQSRAYHACILLCSIWCMMACNAWQYEIEPCDPLKGPQACGRLNLADHLNVETDCIVWQCDPTTLTCQKEPKDFDGDSEPDGAGACQGIGTDCADNDPKIRSGDGTCSCNNMMGPSCRVGVGACQLQRNYVCDTGVLKCPNTEVVQSRSEEYHSVPYTMNNAYSWDWNCNGSGDSATSNVERKCEANLSVPGLTCEDLFCPSPAQPNASVLCNGYCGKFNHLSSDCTAKTHYLYCDKTCGADVLACKCQRRFFLTFPYCGIADSNGVTPTGKVLCK